MKKLTLTEFEICMVLCFNRNLTGGQIARTLHIPQNTVYKRLKSLEKKEFISRNILPASHSFNIDRPNFSKFINDNYRIASL